MPIRAYQVSDQEACLRIFRSNMPDFFTRDELRDFREFLETQTDPYFVVEAEGGVVGCGGVYVLPDGVTAGLTWGMIERARQRKGYGTELLRFRIDWLQHHAPRVHSLVLDTTPISAPFFARFGFETIRVQSDYYAPGIDRHDTQLSLPPATSLLLAEGEKQAHHDF